MKILNQTPDLLIDQPPVVSGHRAPALYDCLSHLCIRGWRAAWQRAAFEKASQFGRFFQQIGIVEFVTSGAVKVIELPAVGFSIAAAGFRF